MSTETPQKQVPFSSEFVEKLKRGEEIMQKNCDIHKANMETAKNMLLSMLNGNVVENDKSSLSGLLKLETSVTLEQVKLIETYCKEPTGLDVWSHKDTGGLAFDVETKQYANYGVSHKECFAQENDLISFIIGDIYPAFKKKLVTREVRDLFLKEKIKEYSDEDLSEEEMQFGGYVVSAARHYRDTLPSDLKKQIQVFTPENEALFLDNEFLVLTTETFVAKVNKEPYKDTEITAVIPDDWDESFLETLCGVYESPYANSTTLPEAVEVTTTV